MAPAGAKGFSIRSLITLDSVCGAAPAVGVLGRAEAANLGADALGADVGTAFDAAATLVGASWMDTTGTGATGAPAPGSVGTLAGVEAAAGAPAVPSLLSSLMFLVISAARAAASLALRSFAN